MEVKERIRILLVDDDEEDSLLVRDVLADIKNQRYSVLWVNTYEKALLELDKDCYDVYLFDYDLGARTGLDLFSEVQSKDNGIPVIILTGQKSREIDLLSMKQGVSDFLNKGKLDSELLERTIRYAITKKADEQQILYLAYYDQLTNLPNRVFFKEQLNLALSRATRYKRMLAVLFLDLANKKNLDNKLLERIALRSYQHLSLIFLDIDHFKVVNDTYGHQTGDEVLKTLGLIINDNKRDYDIAGRYGGEEFLLILPETNQAQALEVAKRLMEKINSTPIKTEFGSIKITASFGISSLIDNAKLIENFLKITSLEDIYNVKEPKTASWNEIAQIKKQIGEQLFKLADNALYEAKSDYCGTCGQPLKSIKQICSACNSHDIRKGRNRIVLS